MKTYWATLHHWEQGQKEVQDKDYVKFWGEVNRLLLKGWVVDCMKLLEMG